MLTITGSPRPARWQNHARWYEASVEVDLTGALVLVRRWGGLGSRRGGQRAEVVHDPRHAALRLQRIHTQRSARPQPYRPAPFIV